MIVTERVLEHLSWQSSSVAQLYSSKFETKTNQQHRLVKVMVAFFTMLLHVAAFSLLLKAPNQSNLIQPEIPIQVSLIKAEENIPNIPQVEPQKVQRKIVPKKSQLLKKIITEQPLIMTEPVNASEEVVEDDKDVSESFQVTEASAEIADATELPVYEPPKFGVSYLNNPPPVYPVEAKRRKQQGVVMLRVLVAANGKPDQMEISESSGVQSLDNAALNAVQNWTFIPAKIGKDVISAYVIVPIRFNLEKR
jgi:protein TonB